MVTMVTMLQNTTNLMQLAGRAMCHRSFPMDLDFKILPRNVYMSIGN